MPHGDRLPAPAATTPRTCRDCAWHSGGGVPRCMRDFVYRAAREPACRDFELEQED